MKKVFLKLMSLAVALLMMLTFFAACTDNDESIDAEEERKNASSNTEAPENIDAFTLFEKIDDAMNAADSYKLTGKMKMNFSMPDYGMTFNMNATIAITESGVGTDDYYSLNEQTMNMTISMVGKSNVKMTNTSMEGFQNGKMFIMNDSGDGEAPQRLYSEISASEYTSDQNDTDSDSNFKVNKDNCKISECSFDKKSGEWTAVYKGFSDEALDELGMGVDDIDEILGEDYTFSDMEMTIVADESYILKSAKTVYVFEAVDGADSDKPEMSAEFTCSGVNSTPKGNTVSLSGYTKVDDLRVLDTVDDAFDDRMEAKAGNFVAQFSENNSYYGTFSEKNEVEYSHTSGGKLRYTIKYTGPGESATISYANGKVTEAYSDGGYQYESTDEEELSYIQSLLNHGDFSASEVTNIKKLSSVSYCFTVRPDMEKAGELVSDAVSSKTTETFTFTLNNGQISKYIYKLKTGNAIGETSELTVTVQFNDVA